MSKRRTRFELVCWELNVDQRLAWPAWELALKHGLLETAGVDAVTGKMMFTLSERGRLALRTGWPAARVDPLTRLLSIGARGAATHVRAARHAR